jgi:hypothetical protein
MLMDNGLFPVFIFMVMVMDDDLIFPAVAPGLAVNDHLFPVFPFFLVRMGLIYPFFLGPARGRMVNIDVFVLYRAVGNPAFVMRGMAYMPARILFLYIGMLFPGVMYLGFNDHVGMAGLYHFRPGIGNRPGTALIQGITF